jgi:hypothetical protein
MVRDEQQTIALPVSIVSPTDIARLTREIEGIDNFFRDQQIRNAGAPNALPRLSKLMDQLAADNQKNLLQAEDRQQLYMLLERLHSSAPVMHISFSVDPPGAYVQKIVEWLRSNIHSYVLVTVGLQPNIGAGCIVRTTNKLFDFSLREFFSEKREFFIEKMHNSMSEEISEAANTPVPSNSIAQIEQPVAQSTPAPQVLPTQTVQVVEAAPTPIAVKTAPSEVTT